MERRTFVRGAFGLTLLAAGASLGIFGTSCSSGGEEAASDVSFTTPEGLAPEAAVGPMMQGGIDLVASEDPNVVSGFFGNTQLFNVDETGATLMTLADGSRTIDDISSQASNMLGEAVNPADAAEFFVTLGEEGYLQNEVYVNLFEVEE